MSDGKKICVSKIRQDMQKLFKEALEAKKTKYKKDYFDCITENFDKKDFYEYIEDRLKQSSRKVDIIKAYDDLVKSYGYNIVI